MGKRQERKGEGGRAHKGRFFTMPGFEIVVGFV